MLHSFPQEMCFQKQWQGTCRIICSYWKCKEGTWDYRKEFQKESGERLIMFDLVISWLEKQKVSFHKFSSLWSCKNKTLDFSLGLKSQRPMTNSQILHPSSRGTHKHLLGLPERLSGSGRWDQGRQSALEAKAYTVKNTTTGEPGLEGLSRSCRVLSFPQETILPALPALPLNLLRKDPAAFHSEETSVWDSD